jgi:hypothetical protein
MSCYFNHYFYWPDSIVNIHVVVLFVYQTEKFMDMPIMTKRKLYACGDEYVTLDEIPSWHDHINKSRRKKIPEPKGTMLYKYEAVSCTM